MVSQSKKALAALRTPAGRLLVVALLCAVCAFTVLRAISMFTLHEEAPGPQGILLAFDAEEIGDFAGKVSGGLFPVTIIDGDSSQIEMVSEGTVKDVLSKTGILIGLHDVVTPGLSETVSEFDEIVIQRREQVLYTEQFDIPYETYYYYSPDVKPGDEVVQVEGQNGLKVDTYSQYLLKGEVVEESLLSEDIVQKPTHREIYIGFKVKPTSPFDFEWSFDNEGRPSNYVKVVQGGRAAGYWAPAGSSTSTGRPAMIGHVAVNPNVIPYGSKLFIQSSDRNFVYGYAIAADTGSSLMQGVIDVDLYYDTYEDCVWNGMRTVDIYVLE